MKTNYTIEQIKAAAKDAVFYEDTDGVFLRIMFTDEDSFTAIDENDLTEFVLYFSDLVSLGRDIKFHKLTLIDL